MWYITKNDIDLVAIGAKFLGCGGGGDTFTLVTLLKSLMKDQRIVVKQLHELNDEWVLPVAIVGSPVLFSERLLAGDECNKMLETYKEHSNKRIDAILPIEIGGMNALLPLIIALETGVPVVDGDGMGRAFPELNMSPLYTSDISITPLALYFPNRESTLFDVPVLDRKQFITELRQQVNDRGGIAYLAAYGAAGRKIRPHIIPNTLRLLFDIGNVIQFSIRREEKIESLKEVFYQSTYGSLETIFQGSIENVEREFVDASIEGSAILKGSSPYANQTMKLYFHNEFLVANINEEILSIVPDLTVVLDYQTLIPYATEEIQPGMAVLILSIKAPNLLKKKGLVEQTGPAGYGLVKEERDSDAFRY